MIIRKAQPADSTTIAEIQVLCWQQRLNKFAPAWFVKQFNAAEQAQKYAERIKTAGTFIYVAEVDGKVVGFTGSRPNTDKSVPYEYELSALYVTPSAEGHGIATALLEQILMVTQKSGAKNIAVFCFAENAPVRRVYEKLNGKLLPYTTCDSIDLDEPHVSYGWKF